MSRPALRPLATQLSLSLGEMNTAIRNAFSEPSSSESALNEAPAAGGSPFKKPPAPAGKTSESGPPRSAHGVLDAVVAALRRLVRLTRPAPPPVPTRPTTKRFRSPRHRIRKH